MKKQVLLLIMMVWAINAMAVRLPSSAFSSFGETADFNLDVTSVSTRGVSYLNSSMTSLVYNGSCTYEAFNGDVGGCQNCCETEFTCDKYDFDCWDLRGSCLDLCGQPLGGVPLGSPLLLLPFIAVYALVRRRKQA